MSLNPSFGQTDSAPGPAAALQALLVVKPDGRVQFATARASLWMQSLFTTASPLDCLPEALFRWLHHEVSEGPSSSFIVDQSERRLSIRLLLREENSVCLVLEQCPGVPPSGGRRTALTERQAEVLSWVARGKTNAEIGKILSLRAGTIGKHLERIFPILGVENRTAAASFALGTSGVG